MNEILNDKLEDIKNIILETILEDKTDIKKWNQDKEICFDEKRFATLFFGDWSRDSKTLLKLDKFLNTTNKPSIIFEEIKKELQRKNSSIYKANFNPNLFFLFFDKFYSLELCTKYKLDFDSLIDENTEHIIGLQILNKEKLENNNILRKEIIRIIEVHSKILFNENIKEYLGMDFYKKTFIKNCVIQKEVQTCYNSKFIDLCYCLDKVILHPNNIDINELHKNEKNNILIEINEEHHSELADNLRNNNLISSSGAKISSYDLTNMIDNNGILFNKQIITNLSKILIKNREIKNDIMKLYLTDVEDLHFNYVNFVVDFKYCNKKFNLAEVFSIINLNNCNEEIDLNKIIKVLHKREFFDTEDYFENYKDFQQIKKDGVEYIMKNISNINLTRLGIESLFYSIDKKYWKEKDEFAKFKIEVESKYLNSVENLLQDDTLDILLEENNIKNSVFHILKDFSPKKFRNNAKKLYKYKNLLHSQIPFVIKCKDKFIDIRIIKLFVDDELFEELEERNTFCKGYLVGYRPLFKSEFDEIMNYKDFEEEYSLIK
jgi:hypothetical protein